MKRAWKSQKGNNVWLSIVLVKEDKYPYALSFQNIKSNDTKNHLFYFSWWMRIELITVTKTPKYMHSDQQKVRFEVPTND